MQGGPALRRAPLHLIEPLAFSLDERQVRRAGLDYWEHVPLRVWPDWDSFERELPALGDAFFFSTKRRGCCGMLRWTSPPTWSSYSVARLAVFRRNCTRVTRIGS